MLKTNTNILKNLFYQYEESFNILKATKLNDFISILTNSIEKAVLKDNFDQYMLWNEVHKSLPSIETNSNEINLKDYEYIKISDSKKFKFETERIDFINILKKYMPWRKGPFEIFGIFIDTEWQSNLKWNRVISKISSLKNKIVLDVGAGNGYYSFKMRGAGAKIVVAVEPYPIFIAQYLLFQKYIKDPFVLNLPLKTEDLPENIKSFDTVFSMGVLYHRISPIEHLMQLFSFLKDGGELVLETLVFLGEGNEILFPKDRYAKMPNVWFIPSIKMLTFWLERVGFKNVECVDISRTTKDEQRKTEWMDFESLESFLDAKDELKTFEGYQAPVRAIFIAKK